MEDFGAIVNCGDLGAKGAKVCSESSGSGGGASSKSPSEGNFVGWPPNEIGASADNTNGLHPLGRANRTCRL